MSRSKFIENPEVVTERESPVFDYFVQTEDHVCLGYYFGDHQYVEYLFDISGGDNILSYIKKKLRLIDKRYTVSFNQAYLHLPGKSVQLDEEEVWNKDVFRALRRYYIIDSEKIPTVQITEW